jgi:hypothetical protein
MHDCLPLAVAVRLASVRRNILDVEVACSYTRKPRMPSLGKPGSYDQRKHSVIFEVKSL